MRSRILQLPQCRSISAVHDLVGQTTDGELAEALLRVRILLHCDH
jgi:hypothetical protein